MLLNVGRNVSIRESDLQKRIELQTEKTLLCDSKVTASAASNTSISCVFVWIFAFFRLCWLLRSSARIFGIKRVEVGVSCCVLFYTYLKFHWERHGQIPFLASRTHQTLDKTCYLNADLWHTFRSNPQSYRSGCRKCTATPTTDRPEAANQATSANR